MSVAYQCVSARLQYGLQYSADEGRNKEGRGPYTPALLVVSMCPAKGGVSNPT